MLYKWLREESPVFQGKYITIDSYVLSRYEDCVMMLNDPRFIRDRTTIILAFDPSELEIQVRPGFHMYKRLPVVLG